MDVDIISLLSKLSGPSADILCAFLAYLWIGRGKEIAALQARVDALQQKIQDMLQSQLEGEPQRRQTLADITRAIADNTNLLRERLRA